MKLPEKKRSGWLRRSVNAIVVIVNVLLAIPLIVSTYAGAVAPSQWGASVIISMTTPVWLAAMIAVFALDLIWWRRTAILAGIALLVAYPAARDFLPMNISIFGSGNDERMTLLTWNCTEFRDLSGAYSGNENPGVNAILRIDADVVCLQECRLLDPNPLKYITPRQISAIHRAYPYVYLAEYNQAILSKYPVEPIALTERKMTASEGQIAAWRLHHPDGRVINIFNVHLKSIPLSFDDKDVFRDVDKLQDINRSFLSQMKHQVFSKIIRASEARAEEIHELEKYIARFGGENVIVCGDFNDVPGCYSLRSLEDVCHLRQVYREVAFGPYYTFNADRLLFRIDHVLYRGQLRPYRLKVYRDKCSDHYSQKVTFALTAK